MLTGVLSLREVVFPSYLVLCPPMGPRVGSLFPGKRPIGETEGFLDELSNSSSSSIENKPWSSSSIVSLRPRLLLLIPLSSPPRRAARESLEELTSEHRHACLFRWAANKRAKVTSSERGGAQRRWSERRSDVTKPILSLLAGCQVCAVSLVAEAHADSMAEDPRQYPPLHSPQNRSRPVGTDIMGLGRENLSECRGRFPKLIGSSKVGGEEPANTPSRVVSPRPRRVLPRKALFGRDEGARGVAKPGGTAQGLECLAHLLALDIPSLAAAVVAAMPDHWLAW
ncbi:hypothetical protein KCV00_g329, partial [Aureobasidium melanogenum]